MSRPLSAEVVFADAALSRWARWAREALSGWPERTVLARVIEEGFTGAAQAGAPLPEMDELVQATEHAVLALAPKERAILLRVYWHAEPTEVSAKECGLQLLEFRRALSNARRRVAWYLQGWQAMSDRAVGGLSR